MKIFRSKEGNISYIIEGEGPSHFLLVHNAGGNYEMMKSCTAHFSKKGKVIVPDLLGHGFSDSPKIEYTPAIFAENLIQLCEYEKINRCIFIGLNYGANIGIEIAKIKPSLLSHLIMIEPPLFMELWIVELVELQIKNFANPREEWTQEVVDSMIVKAPSHERECALKALKSTPAFVKASTYKNLLAWDKKHSFTSSIPTLLIQASKPFCTETKTRTIFSNLHVGRVVGSGPWTTLEVPSQVHSMIDRFLEIY